MSARVDLIEALGIAADRIRNQDVNAQVERLKDLHGSDPDAYWLVARGMVAILNQLAWRLTVEDGEASIMGVYELSTFREQVVVNGDHVSVGPILDQYELILLGIAGGADEPGSHGDATVDEIYGINEMDRPGLAGIEGVT